MQRGAKGPVGSQPRRDCMARGHSVRLALAVLLMHACAASNSTHRALLQNLPFQPASTNCVQTVSTPTSITGTIQLCSSLSGFGNCVAALDTYCVVCGDGSYLGLCAPFARPAAAAHPVANG